MSFERVEFYTRIREVDGSREISPQAVTCVYRLNSIPVARVDLAFGEGFAPGDTEELRGQLDAVQDWIDQRKLLEIVVQRDINDFSDRDERLEQVIFQGYLHAPTIDIGRRDGTYTLQMQHWARDLAIGSLKIDYVLPAHPQQEKAAGLYTLPTQNQGVNTFNPKTVEGVAFRASLEPGWERLMIEDLWANGQKEILAGFLTKEFEASFSEFFSGCTESLNRPSLLARRALERIQGPSKTLGSPYNGGVPLRITTEVAPNARFEMGIKIAQHIGGKRLDTMSKTNAWEQIQLFNTQFGCNLCCRPTDAVIMPLNAGYDKPYEVEVLEDDLLEHSWTSFQQLDIRGIGVLSKFQNTSGLGSFVATARDMSRGCFIGSDDGDAGVVKYVSPPTWMADLPPAGVNTGVARTAMKQLGPNTFRNPPETQSAELRQLSQDMKNNYKNLYDAYAQMLYLETNLQGRTGRFSTQFRVDIAPGSTIKVNLRKEEMKSRIGLDINSLVGLVSSVTLSINRKSRTPVTVFETSYVRTESQLDDPKYTLGEHAYFDQTIPGLPLVEP